MSHEIRTPMIGVMGMADLLLKTPLNERQKGLAETIHKSGDALLSILNDILDFSKIEAGRLELEMVDFDLCHCLEDAVELLSPKAFAKGLELVCIVDERMPVHLRGDAGRLRQVVLNLVGNAVKFTTNGEIVVRVGALMEERSTVWVRLEVRDSGIGIPEDVQGRIFESFSQADTSTSRQFGGTGLGLSIVRQLVEMMGGRIGLESKPGEGSLFWVHLRLEKQPVESRSEVYEILRFPGKKALVATGHAAFGQALVERLAAHGVDALHAGSVQAARSKVESGHNEVSYDLILVDEQLPDGEGIALCRDLHAANSPGASLVLLSTPRTGYGEETLQEAGVVASLSKPIRRENLKKVLHRVFDAPAESGMSPAAENIRKIRPSGAKHQILVAEDNPTTQRLIELLFEDSPYHVRIVPDGMQAVHAVKDNRFDLVLMDCQMPGLDGFEATREIRAGGANLPVIALTAHVGREEVERCREVGMNDYLRKPFKQEELFLMLEKWLSADVAEGKRCIFSTASLS
jgi:CheY-like chemotaxis protein/two-component sensor histidine kinase